MNVHIKICARGQACFSPQRRRHVVKLSHWIPCWRYVHMVELVSIQRDVESWSSSHTEYHVEELFVSDHDDAGLVSVVLFERRRQCLKQDRRLRSTYTTILGQVGVVYTNQTNRKKCHRHLIVLCCSIMSLEHTTENMASVSGPFIKWSLHTTIKRVTRLPEYFRLRPRVLIPSWTKVSTTR